MTGDAAGRVDERRCADAAGAAQLLATEVAALLRGAIDARGTASLVVSGGKSPVPFFQGLRAQSLDWSRVMVTLADERWVSADAPDSNESLLREHLLRDGAARACFVPLKIAAESPAAALADRGAALAALPRPFDAVVLGMGEDGHTASLFPGMPGLAAALDPRAPARLCAGLAPVVPVERISMTIAALLDARRIFLPLQGAAKLQVYREVLVAGDALRFPIAAVLKQAAVPVTVLLVAA